MLGVTALFCCVLVSLVAVWTDVKRREVPHWIIGTLVVLWVLTAVMAPEALNGEPMMGVVCGAAALVVGFCLHALGWLGGGDGKLLAALSMWLGPADLGLALLATGFFGLLLAAPGFVQALLRYSGNGAYPTRARSLPLLPRFSQSAPSRASATKSVALAGAVSCPRPSPPSFPSILPPERQVRQAASATKSVALAGAVSCPRPSPPSSPSILPPERQKSDRLLAPQP